MSLRSLRRMPGLKGEVELRFLMGLPLMASLEKVNDYVEIKPLILPLIGD